jgi:hypothetical protein
MILKRLAVIAIGPLLLLSSDAGSGGANGSVDFSSPQSIAKALDAAGFGCTGFEANPAAVGPKASGSCKHGESEITISIFESAAQRDRVLKSAQEAFGQAAEADGTSVQGGAWLVTADSKSNAESIQKIIGGTVK